MYAGGSIISIYADFNDNDFRVYFLEGFYDHNEHLVKQKIKQL